MRRSRLFAIGLCCICSSHLVLGYAGNSAGAERHDRDDPQLQTLTVSASFSTPKYDRERHRFISILTLTNNGPTAYPPVKVRIQADSSDTSRDRSSHKSDDDRDTLWRYIKLSNGSLLTGESQTTTVTFEGDDHRHLAPTLTAAFGGVSPAGLAVTVTTPTPNQTPAGPTFLVTGTISAPGVAGASLDGVPTCIVGKSFFANAFQPQVAPATFTATANDIDGGQQSISIIVTPNTKGLRVTPTPACGGITPLTTTINVSLDTTDGDSIASETVDFGTGAGAFQVAPGLPAENLYSNPGLYTVTVTATTTLGATLKQQAMVSVQTPAQAFAPMQATMSLLQSALTQGNALRAASLFSTPSRSNYQSAFAALGTRMAIAAGYLSSLSPLSIGPSMTQASFPATVHGVSGYLTIELVPDSTGIWRIESW